MCQISLLAKHEITRLITLITAIAAKMEIDQTDNTQLDGLKQDVHPERILGTMEAIRTLHENSEG